MGKACYVWPHSKLNVYVVNSFRYKHLDACDVRMHTVEHGLQEMLDPMR